MLAVDVLDIDAVQLSHPFGKIGIGCFYQQVVVVGHQAEGMTDPVEALTGAAEDVGNLTRSSSPYPTKMLRRSLPRAVT